MPELRFDPSNAVTFDLESGLVHLEGAPFRLLVPAGALAALLNSAGAEAIRAFGHALGEPMGRRLCTRFAGHEQSGGAEAVRGASLDAMVDHLGGELSLAGLGALSLERWGHALLLVVDHSPLGKEGDAMLEAVLSSALQAATGRAANAVLLGRDNSRARFLIAGDKALSKVRAWLGEGLGWGEVLTRLHGHSAAERGEA